MLPPGGAALIAPVHSLSADGRLISAVATGTDSRRLAFQVHRVPPARTRELLAVAAAAGLLGGDDTRDGTAGPDAPVVRVTAASATRRHTTIMPRADTAVARLRGALDRLALDAGTAYQAAREAVIAVGTDVRTGVVDWPLGTLAGQPLAGLSTGGRCGVPAAARRDEVHQVIERAGAGVVWRSDGQLWMVTIRPLLPDEDGCAALS